MDSAANRHQATFSPTLYRLYNLDLRGLSEDELSLHFLRHPHEPRIYGETRDTAGFLSMRWLRGNGIEIGAGRHPMPLFGNASAIQQDCDPELVFGGLSLDLKASLDDRDFAASREGDFDFAVASHVLEHVDGWIVAIENLCRLTRPGGIIYVIVPDISFLHDKYWMPDYSFEHHIEEYADPLCNAAVHDEVYIRAAVGGVDDTNQHAHLPETYKVAMRNGAIPSELRFLHHKHNYSLSGWMQLLQRTREFLGDRFDFLDIRYGHERMDCHFVLRTRG